MKIMKTRRLTGIILTTVLLCAAGALTAAGAASACNDDQGQQLQLSANVRGYDVLDDGQYLDGVVTNDTSVTVVAESVEIAWDQSTWRKSDACIDPTILAPGQWTAFHADWPCGVPTTWTPVVTALGEPTDATGPIELTVGDLGDPIVDDSGARYYDVTVTNDNPFPVECIQAAGVERDGDTGEFVDALDTGDAPCELAAGESGDFQVCGISSWDGTLDTEMRVTAVEQPTLSLSADTSTPAVGSPVTLHVSLTHADGTSVDGEHFVKILASADGKHWCYRENFPTEDGTADLTVYPGCPLYFKAEFCGDDDLGAAQSDQLHIVPQGTVPPSLPRWIRRHHGFWVRGRMGSGAAGSSSPVTITAERHVGRKWVKTLTVKASAGSSGSYSKSVKLSSAGSYRIRAYRSGVGYSPYRTITVK